MYIIQPDNSKKGSLKVVHKHGPCSTLNQDQAKVPTATQILSRDQSRVKSIQYRVGLNAGQNDLDGSKSTIPTKSGRTIGSGNYIVTVGLGTPKKDQSLIFDTGSDLTWAQCQPCVRYVRTIISNSSSSVVLFYSRLLCNIDLVSEIVYKIKFNSQPKTFY